MHIFKWQRKESLKFCFEIFSFCVTRNSSECSAGLETTERILVCFIVINCWFNWISDKSVIRQAKSRFYGTALVFYPRGCFYRIRDLFFLITRFQRWKPRRSYSHYTYHRFCAKKEHCHPNFFMHFYKNHIVISKWTKFQKISNTRSSSVESS